MYTHNMDAVALNHVHITLKLNLFYDNTRRFCGSFVTKTENK